MNNDQPHTGEQSEHAHAPQMFTIQGIADELGVSSEEVQNAVENVGDDPERVREFIKRNHTETDDTNS